ncbi:hypothetical protein BELL_0128g00140 [Botrytis elliptica]|uniref:Uncharacterized protein n=1 Tax=Botrytis elliptica TaxID=278938 RepID=A0A4Z1K6M4_9HELO|nr:hypothetical protein BELL_0128g00140 [Botrytis elliptica]
MPNVYVPTYSAVVVRPDFDPFRMTFFAPQVCTIWAVYDFCGHSRGRVVTTIITAPTARPNIHTGFWSWYSRHVEDKSLMRRGLLYLQLRDMVTQATEVKNQFMVKSNTLDAFGRGARIKDDIEWKKSRKGKTKGDQSIHLNRRSSPEEDFTEVFFGVLNC